MFSFQQQVYRKQSSRPEACNFIKKETLAQVFSCEFYEISKNTFFIEYLWWLRLVYNLKTTRSDQLDKSEKEKFTGSTSFSKIMFQYEINQQHKLTPKSLESFL